MPVRKIKEETELFYSYLRQNGLKKTYQKDLILETFLNTEGHLSVEDVYSLVKKRDKKVGMVTVFRTLKSLAACGLAREIALGDGLTRFEHSYHHPYHHHIICTECHKAIEFVCPELERIQNEIVEKYHFHPTVLRFQVYGICKDCFEHRRVGETQKHDTELAFARDTVKMALYMEKLCLHFYQNSARRNRDAGGGRLFEQMVLEEKDLVADLNEKLKNIVDMERDLQNVPLFLHFNVHEMEALLPDLSIYEATGELQLDAIMSMETAMGLNRRIVDFFRQTADRFEDTLGKQILLDFAGVKEAQINRIEGRREGMATQGGKN